MLRGIWDLPGPGIEPVSPALAGGFLTTAPPGKSRFFLLIQSDNYYFLTSMFRPLTSNVFIDMFELNSIVFYMAAFGFMILLYPDFEIVFIIGIYFLDR